MLESQISLIKYKEFMEAERKKGCPVGLKNIGNSCYVNCLLQCYFMIPSFVKKILQYLANSKNLSREQNNFIGKLQELFALMIGDIGKWIDPSDFISCLPEKFKIREQQDLGEFNLILIENIQKAFECELSKLSQSMIMKTSNKKNIEKYFIGYCKEILKFANGQGEKKKNISDGHFTEIGLDTMGDDFYSAWYLHIIVHISDYGNECGEKTEAFHETWITKLPYVMFFRMNKSQENQNGRVNFALPDVIYPELFMYENRKILKNIQRNREKIEEKIKKLRKKMLLFSEFDMDSHCSVISSLVNSEAWRNLSDRPEGEKNDQEILGNIDGFQQTYAKKNLKLQQKLVKLEESLKNIYAFAGIPYILHSLIVYSGTGNKGHYYAYIHDFYNNQWNKYNDANITSVEYSEIIETLSGKSKCTSITFAIYTHKKLFNKRTDLPMCAFSPSYPLNLSDEYSLYLPDHLIKLVNNHNKNLQIDFKKNVENEILSVIQFEYFERYKKIAQQANRCKNPLENALKYCELGNLAIVLWQRISEDTAKWYILDLLLKEHNPDFSLKTIYMHESLYLNLITFSKKHLEAPYNFKLSADNSVKFTFYTSAYKEVLVDLEIAIVVLDKILDKNITVAIKIVSYFFQITRINLKSILYLHMTEISQILILYLISEILNFCKVGDLDAVSECVEKINFLNTVDYGLDFRKMFKKIIKEITNRYCKGTSERFVLLMDSLLVNEVVLELLDLDFEELSNLNQRISQIDPYEWREEWTATGLLPKVTSRLLEVQEKDFKFWNDLRMKPKLSALRVSDFEVKII